MLPRLATSLVLLAALGCAGIPASKTEHTPEPAAQPEESAPASLGKMQMLLLGGGTEEEADRKLTRTKEELKLFQSLTAPEGWPRIVSGATLDGLDPSTNYVALGVCASDDSVVAIQATYPRLTTARVDLPEACPTSTVRPIASEQLSSGTTRLVVTLWDLVPVAGEGSYWVRAALFDGESLIGTEVESLTAEVGEGWDAKYTAELSGGADIRVAVTNAFSHWGDGGRETKEAEIVYQLDGRWVDKRWSLDLNTAHSPGTFGKTAPNFGCALGLVRVGERCCWPGQTVDGDACVGQPVCPPGTTASASVCVPAR